jgi:hypothetical protein
VAQTASSPPSRTDDKPQSPRRRTLRGHRQRQSPERGPARWHGGPDGRSRTPSSPSSPSKDHPLDAAVPFATPMPAPSPRADRCRQRWGETQGLGGCDQGRTRLWRQALDRPRAMPPSSSTATARPSFARSSASSARNHPELIKALAAHRRELRAAGIEPASRRQGGDPSGALSPTP